MTSIELTDEEILRLIEQGITPDALQSLSRRIIRNAARCSACGDVIESTHRHDMRWCSCRSVAVDGGLDYLRRLWQDGIPWDELSEHRDLTADEVRSVVAEILELCPPVDPEDFAPDAPAVFRAEMAQSAKEAADG